MSDANQFLGGSRSLAGRVKILEALAQQEQEVAVSKMVEVAEDRLEEVIKAAANVVADAALRLIEADPHQFSKRPCWTCSAVTALIQRPFGCYRLASTIK